MAEVRSRAAEPGSYLLCYDGSESAANAIRRGAAICGGGRTLVVYAWLPPSALLLQGRRPRASHPLGPAVEEFDVSARESAEQVAAEGAGIAEEAGFEAEAVAVAAPHGVWRPIVELAEERGVDAVVVGSHARSPAKSAFLGSVSHGIASHSSRPVLVVPPEGT